MHSERPRRSVLYVPASNPRALAKAASLPADAFIFDLEDAVAPADKVAARENLRAAWGSGAFGQRERAIRVNARGTAWGADDLALCAELRPDAVVLPKVESAASVEGLDRPVWCMIETPRGVLNAAEIAAAPFVAALVAGTSDLAKGLRVRPHPERLPLLHSLSAIVLAARAAGMAALDGVCLALDDLEAFEREAAQGVALGFDGKTLIHPRTIEIANRLFAPDAAELAEARRVVAAWEATGTGLVVVDGRLVEALHVEAARRRLALAQAIENMEKS